MKVRPLILGLAAALVAGLAGLWWTSSGVHESVHGMSEAPCTQGGQPITGSDWGQLCVFRAANAQLIEKRNFPTVVMIGDSITQGWPKPGEGFANRGIGGQVSGQVLLRFRQDAIALKPKVIHILVGINDVTGTAGPEAPDMLRNNIRSMVAQARQERIPTIVGTIGPAQDVDWRPQVDRRRWVPVINRWLAQYAQDEGLVLADYHGVLSHADGSMREELFADTVHPNAAGYAAMDRVLDDAIERAGKSRQAAPPSGS